MLERFNEITKECEMCILIVKKDGKFETYISGFSTDILDAFELTMLRLLSDDYETLNLN